MNTAELTKPLISVIVPVYKVEQYLTECVESILAQTYKNLEIILVDDGSPDKCPEICENLAKKDARIRVIHKKNGGLSSARNAGLDIATGAYTAFVDSDDSVDPDMLSTMYQWLIDNDADVAMCGTVKCFDAGERDYIDRSFPVKYFTRDAALRSFLYHRERMASAVWNKLFDSRFFHGDQAIRFPEGLNSEDYFVLSRVYNRMKGLYFNSCPFYQYRIRSNSITTQTKLDKHSYDKAKIAELCCQYLEENGYSDTKALAYARMQGWYDVLYDLLGKKVDNKAIRFCKKNLRKKMVPVLLDFSLSLSRRAKVLMMAFVPKLYHYLSSK